jgi:hypothetical protein
MGRSFSIGQQGAERPSRSAFRLTLIAVAYCMLAYGAQAQKLEVYPTAGITWRSTLMNFFNFDYVWPYDNTVPFDYERNIQGLGLNIGCLLQGDLLGIEYYPSFRYDVTHFRFRPPGSTGVHYVTKDDYYKSFLVDHNVNLLFRRKKLDFGFGFSLVNAGKGFHFENPFPRYQRIEFKTYSAFVTIPIKKVVHLELKAHYIPERHPQNPYQKYMSYSIRLYHRFGFLNKKQ